LRAFISSMSAVTVAIRGKAADKWRVARWSFTFGRS
jgi:hypothetical protein